MSRERETDSLEEIGSQFQTIRLKFGVERRTDKFDTVPEEVPRVSLDMVESWTGDVMENREEEPQASAGLIEFYEGDVCFSKLRPYLAKAFEAEYFGAASPEFLVFEPTQFETRFLRYLILSREFIERVDASTYGAKMPRASWNFIGDVRVPCPDESEQREIAKFLDRRTARIDALVEKQKRLLDLLDEKKRSLISQNVSGRSDVSTAGQTNEWFAEIPDGWYVTKLKRIAEVIDTKHRTAEYVDDGIPIVSPSEVSSGRLSLEECQQTTEEEYTDLIEGRRKPERGDIIYSRNASVGSAALVDTDEKFCMGQDLCLIRTNGSGTYLHYVLNSAPVQQQVESVTVGATFNRINVSTIKDIELTWPQTNEQNGIANYLDLKTKQFRKTKVRVTQAINLLEEKRQALITAAVTGQIDVTEERDIPQDQSV